MIARLPGTEQRAAYALDGPRTDQLVHVGRNTTPDRRHSEERNPQGEDAPPPKVIAECPAHEHEGSEEKQIRLHDPLQVGGRCMQVCLQHWQGDVDDGAIDKGHA